MPDYQEDNYRILEMLFVIPQHSLSCMHATVTNIKSIEFEWSKFALICADSMP